MLFISSDIMKKNGLFIVIDGVDGSGKATQTKLLVERLRKEGQEVEKIDFPQYGTWSAVFVEKYLRGEFGSAQDVSAKQASLFYALDRFAASEKIKQWLNEGKIVISNRYVSANKGHQLGKITKEEERKECLNWLNEAEYGLFQIPVPNLTIFLHMKPEIGQHLVDKKAPREYTQGKKRDIHEEDLDHLRNAEQAFLFCVKNDTKENWIYIPCDDGQKPKLREEIHQQIYQKVKSHYENL